MKIDLNALQDAMSDISSVGHLEHEFEINGKSYVFWPLTAEQDRQVFEYAQSAVEDYSGETQTQAESIAYMDRFRIAAIAQALVVIGDLDLRGVDEVETGVVLNNGVPEKLSRYQAVRRFVEKWTKTMIEQFFIQFGEMTNRIEDKTRKAIKYTPSDLSAEIDHLGERLEWVDEQLKKHENPDPDLSTKLKNHVTKLTQLQSRQRSLLAGGPVGDVLVPDEAQEGPRSEPRAPEEPKRPAAPQAFSDAGRPVSKPPQEDVLGERVGDGPAPRFAGRKVSPPVERSARPAPVQPPPPAPTPEDAERRFHEENPDVLPGEDLSRYTETGDSLMGDDENASVMSEARRQAALRQQRIQKEIEQTRLAEERFAEGRNPEKTASEGPLQTTSGGVIVAPGQVIPGQQRTPAPLPTNPHRGAKEAQQAVEQALGAQGLPTYELPRVELTKRTKQEGEDHRSARVPVNPGSGGDSLNPRFAGRTKK